MLTPQVAARFTRDLRRMERRGKEISKLRTLILSLLQQQPLAARYRDHKLKGQWSGYRECHVEPDWLLIYQVNPPYLRLERTGTHEDLFGR